MSASEKLELIRLVKGSQLSVRQTLAQIGLSRPTCYAWYERHLEGGPDVTRNGETTDYRRPRQRRGTQTPPPRLGFPLVSYVFTGFAPRKFLRLDPR